MTNTTENLCNEEHLLLLPKFGINLLKPPIFMQYSFSILLQLFDNIF